jgi:hypothetical protein
MLFLVYLYCLEMAGKCRILNRNSFAVQACQVSFNFNVAPEHFQLWKFNGTEDYCVSVELWERHVLQKLLVKPL